MQVIMSLPLNFRLMKKLNDLYGQIEQQNTMMRLRTTELSVMERDDDVALLRAALRINVSSVTLLQTISARLSHVQSRGLFVIPDLNKLYDDDDEEESVDYA
jgi:hypothetical protein